VQAYAALIDNPLLSATFDTGKPVLAMNIQRAEAKELLPLGGHFRRTQSRLDPIITPVISAMLTQFDPKIRGKPRQQYHARYEGKRQ